MCHLYFSTDEASELAKLSKVGKTSKCLPGLEAGAREDVVDYTREMNDFPFIWGKEAVKVLKHFKLTKTYP